MIIKERLEEALTQFRNQIALDVRNNDPSVDFFDTKYLNKALSRVNFDVGTKLVNFLATGNLVSPTGLDLQQASGFTIVAEKLNWQRYISHFRSIHRGSFFAELKTTAVRKLLPEAWGMHAVFVPLRSLTNAYLRISLSCAHPGRYTMWST